MGSANLTEKEIAMRYPPSIIEWEMKHGIGRYEKDGMLYVAAMRPFDEVCESILKEKEQRETLARIRKRGEANESQDHN